MMMMMMMTVMMLQTQLYPRGPNDSIIHPPLMTLSPDIILFYGFLISLLLVLLVQLCNKWWSSYTCWWCIRGDKMSCGVFSFSSSDHHLHTTIHDVCCYQVLFSVLPSYFWGYITTFLHIVMKSRESERIDWIPLDSHPWYPLQNMSWWWCSCSAAADDSDHHEPEETDDVLLLSHDHDDLLCLTRVPLFYFFCSVLMIQWRNPFFTGAADSCCWSSVSWAKKEDSHGDDDDHHDHDTVMMMQGKEAWGRNFWG